MSRPPITCHVLDSSTGKPASGVEVCLYHESAASIFEPLAQGQTNSDGRCLTLFPSSNSCEVGERQMQLKARGLYKVVFKTKEYFDMTGRECFYPWVEIIFEIVNPEEHYHIPLLISPYSFTTYRGS